MNWPKGVPRGKRAVIPVGQKFNRLLVVERDDSKTKRTYWICKCDCGETISVAACDVASGHTKSCGCFNQESRVKNNTKHGYNRTPTYVSWSNMIARCSNPKRLEYKNYGGRGISVCDRWLSFENFVLDMGEKPNLRTLDRINNDGNYEPSNCRWATASEQRRNQRTKDELRAAAAIGKEMT